DVPGTDVQVGDRANARADRPQAEAAPRAALDELCRRGAAGSGLEEHDVGLRFPRRPPDAGNARESRGEPPGIGMVAREPLDVLVEGVQAGGGGDAGLAHGPAEGMLEPAGAGDVRLAAREDRPDRRAQALREVDPD